MNARIVEKTKIFARFCVQALLYSRYIHTNKLRASEWEYVFQCCSSDAVMRYSVKCINNLCFIYLQEPTPPQKKHADS